MAPGPDLRSILERNRIEILDLVRLRRGRSIAVFGSVARGEATSESDIDFLVEFEPSSSLAAGSVRLGEDGQMPRIDDTSISIVLDQYLTERARLVELLAALDDAQWALPTECPAYSVKGIASHILGDDLSLLSRQRDGAMQGLVLMAERMPGADFRALLDGFNDQWVEATRFLSPPLLVHLLDLAGRWTHQYYCQVDPTAPGEPVPMFGVPFGQSSPFWHAIAREYLERWAHHSQIRRALGIGSLADAPFLEIGHAIIATVAGVPIIDTDAPPDHPADDDWLIGPIRLGGRAQAADILTLRHTADDVAALVDGPADLVREFASRVGRR
jgi:uncharacterized protein (TIGR03083 family)